MTERFTYFKSKIGFGKQGIDDNLKGYTFDFTLDNVLDCMNELAEENEKLKKQLQSEHTMLDNAILLERTRMGQSALKQYKEAIQ